MKTVVMWFRKDLRIEDNQALNQALLNLRPDEELLCVFQLNPQQFKPNTLNHDHFFTALEHFRKTLTQGGVTLHFLKGSPISSFEQLKANYPAWHKIYFNQDQRGFGRQRDEEVVTYFKSVGIEVNAFMDGHLHQPQEVQTKTGTAYKKFTPYYNQWIKLPKPLYRKVPLQQSGVAFIEDQENFQAGQVAYQDLLAKIPLDFKRLVGEVEAERKLNAFVLNKMKNYGKDRDIPSVAGTSQLSPYLRTGELSIRKVWLAATSMEESEGQTIFLKELAWRDFYHMIYYFNPDQKDQELQVAYRGLPWKQGDDLFEQWKAGQTGYPIVDAGMRQLNQTGWMHNRLRMIVASFLTKDLLIDWRLGEKYFAEKLIDYDPASNIGGWQWAASTGTDAVPYFRIFNPTTQSQKFDKNGDYIRRYVPELVAVPGNLIHEPALMTSSQQKQYQCQIGQDYPGPIVDHQVARKLAIELFKQKY